MNPVTPIDGFEYFGERPAKPKSELDMETFMRLLTIQLINQNPLEPMNDRDFFAQMAQLGQVEGLDQLQASQDMLQATNYIGKTVAAVRPASSGVAFQDPLVVGPVVGVVVRNGSQMLQIQESNGGLVEVKLGAIQSVAYENNLQNSMDASQAVTLIGKNVKALNIGHDPENPDDDFVEGTVERINFQNAPNIVGIRTKAGELEYVMLAAVAEVN
ncbi:MAG: flagellar hook capping FlgD N-terminal domain-containing protein [Fimbriimonadaceae bacterium]